MSRLGDAHATAQQFDLVGVLLPPHFGDGVNELGREQIARPIVDAQSRAHGIALLMTRHGHGIGYPAQRQPPPRWRFDIPRNLFHPCSGLLTALTLGNMAPVEVVATGVNGMADNMADPRVVLVADEPALLQ